MRILRLGFGFMAGGDLPGVPADEAFSKWADASYEKWADGNYVTTEMGV